MYLRVIVDFLKNFLFNFILSGVFKHSKLVFNIGVLVVISKFFKKKFNLLRLIKKIKLIFKLLKLFIKELVFCRPVNTKIRGSFK